MFEESHSQDFFSKVSDLKLEAELLVSDYRDLGAQILKNIFKNSKQWAFSKRGARLENRFKNVPAIICGAGHSLEKNKELLFSLKDKALLFAGGSAINALSFSPHFCAAIDPDPPYRNFFLQTGFETPFFYQTRVASDLLNLAHAPLLWTESSGSYPIESWLFPHDPFDGGWNVSTYLCAIAQMLGCNPIIFVGVDLIYREGEKYSGGIESQNEMSALLKYGDSYTQRDWLMAKKWLEGFAADHSKTHFINASEGLTLSGIAEMSLPSIEKAYLQRTLDLNGKVQAELSSLLEMEITSNELEISLDQMDKSLERCLDITAKLIKACETKNMSGGEKALLEFELLEEDAYKNILEPIWEKWRSFFLPLESENLELHQLLFFQKVIHNTYSEKI